ncbi:uncharacterized protein LOC135196641 [Macrobrachium nipponense]|uniref:uncharacterized protein LOC135196641 n=1 Tax=Macrobrachium nipponense TaxID=159736 RepID=UPI0030C864B4
MFSDASNEGYGAAAYIRLSDSSGRISTALLMGKSRVCPVKATTIPRLELTAAVVSINLAQHILKELQIAVDQTFYHTDSTTVLHYIFSDRKRFPIFVANRVKVIKDFSENTQWRYVQSKENPADIASRGFTSQQMLNSNIWFDGPYFLRGPEELWKNDMPQDDVELEGSTSFAVHPEDEEGNAVDKFLKYYSSWHRLRKAVAVYHRLFFILKSKRQTRLNGSITADELDAAGKAVIRYIQEQENF